MQDGKERHHRSDSNCFIGERDHEGSTVQPEALTLRSRPDKKLGLERVIVPCFPSQFRPERAKLALPPKTFAGRMP